MKRIFVLGLFAGLFATSFFAQQTLIYTHSDALLNEGKALFVESKYTASFRILEEYMSTTDLTQMGQRQEADYYLAANAFYLGSDDSELRLQRHLDTYPYTPFLSQINYMLGVVTYNQLNYTKALMYFNDVYSNDLDKRMKADFLFHKGYSLLEVKEYNQALLIFRELKNMDTRYNVSATYYHAYAEYCLKNYEGALTEFTKVKDNPEYKNIVPYYMVQIYFAQQDFDKLKPLAEQLLQDKKSNTSNAEIHRIMGEIAYSEQNYPKAIEHLRNYETSFPQAARYDLYLLGLSYFQTQDYKNTIQYLSKVTTEDDAVTENAYLHLGYAYIKQGDKANARMAYEASLRTNFNPSVREEALFNYALTSYESETAFGESVKSFEQFLTEFPQSKHTDKAYDYLSSVYMTTKNYQAAYESILRIKKPNAQMLETKQYVLYQLGTEAFAQNQFTKSIEYFSLSLESSTTGLYSAECYFWRAESYYRTKQANKSAADLKSFFADKNAQTSVNYVAAHYSLGYSLFTLQQYTDALQYFLRYISLEKDKTAPHYTDALNRAGDCYFSQRDFGNAEEYYAKVIAANANAADYALFQSAYVDGLRKNHSSKIKKLETLGIKYPNSEYSADALYEMGRAYLTLDNNNQAIIMYDKILKQYPNADIARKAALETGMVYSNMGNTAKAIEAYKNVIETYHGSEEAYTALESLETLHIDKNDVAAYIQYTQTLSPNMGKRTVNHVDSISYLAAEKLYINGKYADAINGMRDYLSKYCPGGRYCTTARYYLANSYYQTGDKDNALVAFLPLLELGTNQYTEETVMRCAEITFDKKDYAASLAYFKQLQEISKTNNNKNIARLGILRCSYFINDYQTTITVVDEIMNDSQATEQVKSEARYNRAKAYLALQQSDKALNDLKIIAQDTRTEAGAEAKYLTANIYYEQDKLKEAEAEILNFTEKNTPHQFWLARSMVLLADINIKLGDDFQAKQYLLSLQRNYQNEEIQALINERLAAINEREKVTP